MTEIDVCDITYVTPESARLLSNSKSKEFASGAFKRFVSQKEIVMKRGKRTDVAV